MKEKMSLDGFVGFYVQVNGEGATPYIANARAALKKARELSGEAVAEYKDGTLIAFTEDDLPMIPKSFGGDA